MNAERAETYANFEITLPEEFGFFPRFYITAFFITVFSIGLIVILWLPIAYFYFLGDLRYAAAMRASTYLTATFLLLFLLGGIFKREIGKVSFIVSREGITRSDSYRKIAVQWHEISVVRCRKFPLIKGFAEIETGRGRLILPSTIAGFGRLGLALRRGLEQAGKANLLDDAKFRTLNAFGLVSERWNERARDAFRPFAFATAVTAIFNMLVASRLWEMETIPVIIWTGLGLPVPLISYSVADLLLNRRLQKALVLGNNAGGDDSGVHTGTALIVGLSFGVFGIFFKTLFIP